MAKQAINAKTIKKFDKSDMLSLLMDFPAQFQAALDIVKNSGILFQRKDFNKIVFAGLGGSAIGADLVRSYLYFQSNIQISVFREYQLPGCIDSQSLVFLSSYSGNTEETLSAYEDAKGKGATLIAVSGGGRLKELCARDKVTLIQIPKGLPPRCALGYLSIVPLCLLAKLGLIRDVEPAVREAMKLLENLRDNNLNPRIAGKDNISKFIAAKLVNRLAVIYSPSVHLDVCAVRFRGQLAENSKSLAWHHLLPEMNHNEIVGWENPKKLFKGLLVIMLCDKMMHPRLVKRVGITTELIRKQGVELIEVHSRGEGLLARIFSLIYIGDFVSYYLALSYGIDPTPVERITYLKNKLAQG